MTVVVNLAFSAFAAQAGKTAVKGRNVWYNVKTEWTEVGDVEGHVIGHFESTGVACRQATRSRPASSRGAESALG